MDSGTPTLIKIGETYLNLNLVTHVTFEGHNATVYLACQLTDIDGKNGSQALLTFESDEAHQLMRHLRERAGAEPV